MPRSGGYYDDALMPTTRNKRDVWLINTVPYKGGHFAAYPPKLAETCILAGCPAGGVVLDPFFGSGTTGLPVKNCGRVKTHTQMPLVFANSKINLNITAKSIRSGLPLRIFDVLGAGGFLITNYQSELPEIFSIGKDLVAYESPEHLKELCTYYLWHEDERLEIAHNGYETIAKYHTYDIRLLQIIDKAFS